MASHTIVAVYDTHAHADLAIAELTAAGVPASSIQHYAEESRSGVSITDPSLTQEKPTGGFWAWLTGEDDYVATSSLYDQSIERGHTVVTVIADDIHVEKVSRILEDHAPLEIEERDGEYSAAGGVAGASGAAYSAAKATTPPAVVHGEAGLASKTGVGEEVLSLAEESLQVGKRVVDAGVTRLRRYTVERPVEEQVRLRDETVNIFRRPLTGTIASDAFTDKTIEMKQTREEAVVAKTAHVVEEVVLQKDVRDRVETVHDTVRKEEVEVIGGNTDRIASKPAAA